MEKQDGNFPDLAVIVAECSQRETPLELYSARSGPSLTWWGFAGGLNGQVIRSLVKDWPEYRQIVHYTNLVEVLAFQTIACAKVVKSLPAALGVDNLGTFAHPIVQYLLGR